MSTLDWIILIVVGVLVIAVITYLIVKFTKMTPEKRHETLIAWFESAVTWAEETFKQGDNKAKLEAVIKRFSEKSGLFNKILLKLCGGKEKLPELIGEAVDKVQNAFRKEK